MKCPNCNEKHNPFSPLYQVKYTLEEANKENMLSICTECGSVINCKTKDRYYFFIIGCSLIYIGLFFVFVILLPDNFMDSAGPIFLIGYFCVYMYSLFKLPAYFMNYEVIADKTVNLTIHSLQSQGWKIFSGYVVIAILATILIINRVDFTFFVDEIWLPILFVVCIGVLLYLAGLILLRYTVREKLSGTKFELNK